MISFFPQNKKLFLASEKISSPTRDMLDDKYKWDLTHIYSSDVQWEEDFKWVENNIEKYKNYEGSFRENAAKFYECLSFDDSIGIKLERLYLYAMLWKDSDLRNTKYQALDDRIKTLFSKVSAANSFIRPELLEMDDKTLLGMIDSMDELKIYRHAIDDLLRTKAHTLTKEKEELMAFASDATQTSYTAYSLLTNADIKFPFVKDENGKKIEMTYARYYASIFSKDREFRKRAFKAHLKPFFEYKNTIAALFNGNLKTNIFNAKVRNYNSAREASLDKNNISLRVYDNVIGSANNNLAALHRWAELKKRILNIKELHPYDVYVSLFNEKEDKKYTYEESIDIILDALKPLGEEYLSSLEKAFENRWIDVYETQAKRSGAYSSGTTYGIHPYVLLNWADMLNDVFTLAHEMGHNMHSYYTGITQPYSYANYSIFLAEVASTFNESLLLDYLINKAETREEKLYLLEKYLNNITATFYRQIMFAEYERDVYDLTESGTALTSDSLCDLYKNIYQKYWGPQMIIDKEEEYTWARVPHFYYNFYVYQYATGYAASQVLSQKVKKEGKPAVEKYINFLKSGSSNYSIDILASAGVDMNSPQPIVATAEKMNKLLDEIDDIIK